MNTTTYDLPTSEHAAVTQTRVPTRTGALVGGSLIVLSGVIGVLFHQLWSPWAGAFGRLPGLSVMPENVLLIASAISPYLVSAAWILLGVLVMTSARRQIVLAATLGTVFSVLFLVVQDVELVFSLRQIPLDVFPVGRMIANITESVLMVLAFGVCIVLGGNRLSLAPKTLSIVTMALSCVLSFSIYATTVIQQISDVGVVIPALGFHLQRLVPLLLAIGWIVMIASVKVAARPAVTPPVD